MDTRYWGPSGWRLLHLISFAAKTKPTSSVKLTEFFETIAYVLPCKYCRKSFSEYILDDPVEKSVHNLPRWLWRVHNDVNAKLRGQHIPTYPDPPFQAVETVYNQRIQKGCSRTAFEGWEFLFSIAESHPLSRQSLRSTAIQGHPALDTIQDPLQKNRWNILEPEERLVYYNRFWELLPDVLPFVEWTRSWKRAVSGKIDTICRVKCLKGLWAIRRKMEADLELLNRTTYTHLCKELNQFRSGCSSSARGKTCRKNRRTS